MGWATRGKSAVSLGELSSPTQTTLLFEVENDAVAVIPQGSEALNGSATGNGGDDCGGTGLEKSLTYPCGTSYEFSNPVPLYVTGNIGGRILNGGTGSRPRHEDGANYLACDGHVKWVRPESVSGGRSAQSADCHQGSQTNQPADCYNQTSERAAGTGDSRYSLTFSVK